MATPPIQFSRPARIAALSAKYEGRAPRYTSYPTAVQFTGEIGEGSYRRWLSELSPSDPISLYLHIPFCSRLCWYCGCNTKAVMRHEPVAAYVATLLDEIDLLAAALPGKMPVGSIHLGGGTPNMLTEAELSILLHRLRDRFNVLTDVEISIELDPARLTADWVRAAASLGMNRASLGVQNLDPEVQKAVNRQESFSRIRDCAGWLRHAGVRAFNIDLMYGLPLQTVDNTLSTLEQILHLRPSRVALFGYAHVPWMKAHQQLIKDHDLPGPAERWKQSEAAALRLTQAGYERIGLDHFALPTDPLAQAAVEGRLRRNFQGYTAEPYRTVLGLGASSIGQTPQGFVQNLTQERLWRELVLDGRLPINRGVEISEDDRFRGEIIERLMCNFEADLIEICTRHGRAPDTLSLERRRLADFEADGLVRWENGRLKVVGDGRQLVRSVCALFDRYLASDPERHARAV